MSFMKKILLSFIIIIFVILPANASKTKWQDIGLGASIRLFTDNVKLDDGSRYIAIEIKMPNSVKTYWRIPGETGIPLGIEVFDGEQKIPSKIIWAFPKPESQYGTYDFVYYGSLILPVKIPPLDAKSIVADIFLGICENICIPVNVSFELDLTKTRIKKSDNLRLAQAISDAPIKWEEENDPIDNIEMDIEKGIIEFDYNSEIIDANSIILDNGDLNILFSSPQKTTKKDRLAFQLLNIDKAETLLNKPIKFTFLTEQGAYELIKIIKKP